MTMVNTFNIGKERISGDGFFNSKRNQMSYSRPDMPPHWVSNDRFRLLGSSLEGFFDYLSESIS